MTKTEKPVHHAGWIGPAAVAATALVFPVLLPGVVAPAGQGSSPGSGIWRRHQPRS